MLGITHGPYHDYSSSHEADSTVTDFNVRYRCQERVEGTAGLQLTFQRHRAALPLKTCFSICIRTVSQYTSELTVIIQSSHLRALHGSSDGPAGFDRPQALGGTYHWAERLDIGGIAERARV
jgi:hypothetical protein